MTRRAITAGALVCAVALGCDGGPHGLDDAQLLEVWVFSPHASDQALLVKFDDPVEAFDPTPAVRHFQDAAGSATTILLVADWPLPAGESRVGTARLRTRSRTTLPTARVVEAARSDFQLRETVADYGVRLVPIDP